MMVFDIHAAWDAEAGVWIATSEDVLGLCVQAETFDELVEVVTNGKPCRYACSDSNSRSGGTNGYGQGFGWRTTAHVEFVTLGTNARATS